MTPTQNRRSWTDIFGARQRPQHHGCQYQGPGGPQMHASCGQLTVEALLKDPQNPEARLSCCHALSTVAFPLDSIHPCPSPGLITSPPLIRNYPFDFDQNGSGFMGGRADGCATLNALFELMPKATLNSQPAGRPSCGILESSPWDRQPEFNSWTEPPSR